MWPSFLWLSLRSSDSDAVFLHDPKTPYQRFLCQYSQESATNLENMWPILPLKAKDDDSGMFVRGVDSNVGEVQVQRDESPLFVTCYFDEFWIWGAN